MAQFKSTSQYIATRDLEVAVNAAVQLQRPLLVKGEPGTGKTMLAHEVAEALGLPLIEWHVKSTTRAQQGLYEYDAVSRLRDGQLGDPRVHDIGNYIVRGKLWEAFEADHQTVVLIDEIDKADIEFPNDLLLELDRMQFFVYETRETVVARHRPVIIITSNNEKELPDAFLRRCFFHYIRFPDRETMERIVQAHYPDIKSDLAREALNVFFAIREAAGLKKKPATSELLDWLKLLMIEDLPASALRSTDAHLVIPPLHGALLKNEQDVHLFERIAFLSRRGSLGAYADFITALRKAGVPVSITEHLALLGAMKAGVADYSTEDFYFLARATLVKDERYFDRFDQQFGLYFKALEPPPGDPMVDIPAEWLTLMAQKHLTPEEMAQIEAMGGLEALMETLRERLAEQEGRHEGGSKWIGTGGTSPFGSGGYNPEGVRIGDAGKRQGRAVKVWDKREFKDLDDGVQLGTRNLKLALRKLRRFARQGAATQLDIDNTIRATANNAGLLDLKLTPERRNAVKVLLFLDIGGSMDVHVKSTSELFSAARSEFKHLEHFYFHNCVYDQVWKANVGGERVSTLEVMRTYGQDYRLIFVGDASMAPYELDRPGGAIDFWNAEAGAVWLQRLIGHYRRSAWLNPTPQKQWGYMQTIEMITRLMGGRMFPLTLAGLDGMIGELKK